ncbi:MAG: hypothetical protein SFU86_08955 [Pirellulaceae bacterium]|nr:hypothetical protein [Pirellulaceae bacterium]
MTDEDIAEFGHLWSLDAQHHYCLIYLRSGAVELERCVIFSRNARTAKLISDDQLATEVKRKMVEAGVPILRSLPEA